MIEEAIVEEVLYAIANLANSEEHLMETAYKAKNLDTKFLLKLADAVREMRQRLGSTLFGKGKNEKDYRSSTGEIWCCLKHHLISKIHIIESIEKFVRAGDIDNAEKLLEVLEDNEYIIKVLVKMLRGGKNESGKKAASNNK